MKEMKRMEYQSKRGRFHYREWPSETGPTLVLLHGWPESSHCWEGVVAALDFPGRIIAPDMRGLGDSERSLELAAYHKHELAQDMLGLLEELGVETCILGGHDWGGAVAQEMAFLAPERISRLILLNISLIHNLSGNLKASQQLAAMGFYPYWYQYVQQQVGLFEALITGRERVWLSYFLTKADRTPLAEASVDEYVRCFEIPDTPTSSANYYRSFRADVKRWTGYAGRVLPMPTLYLYGNQDPIIFSTFLQDAEKGFADFQLKEISAGHFVLDEEPEAVAIHLREFLS